MSDLPATGSGIGGAMRNTRAKGGTMTRGGKAAAADFLYEWLFASLSLNRYI
jgi:hypothetical protein